VGAAEVAEVAGGAGGAGGAGVVGVVEREWQQWQLDGGEECFRRGSNGGGRGSCYCCCVLEPLLYIEARYLKTQTMRQDRILHICQVMIITWMYQGYDAFENALSPKSYLANQKYSDN
jgi:hypothetical protein